MPDNTKTKAGPSIRPSAFVNASLIEATADDIIRMYHNEESKRRRNDDKDYSQSDVPIPFRSVPEGILEVLDRVSEITGFRRSVVTKCLSRHVMAWYQGSPKISSLVCLYKNVQERSDGFPDVIRRVKRDDYEFVNPRVVNNNIGVLRTVAFVLGYLGDISSVLGIPSYKLFLSGLCWSLSTSRAAWAQDTTAKFLVPEYNNLNIYLGERLLALDYANKVIKLRQGDKEVVDYVSDLECGG